MMTDSFRNNREPILAPVDPAGGEGGSPAASPPSSLGSDPQVGAMFQQGVARKASYIQSVQQE